MIAYLQSLSKRRKLFYAIVLTLSVLLTGIHAYQRRAPTEKEMKSVASMTEHMRTHCAGRYLIDLPEGFFMNEDSEAALFIGLDFYHDILRIKPGLTGQSKDQFKAWVHAAITKWQDNDKEMKKFATPGERQFPQLAKIIPYGDEVLLRTRDGNIESVALCYLGYRDDTSFGLVRTANSDEEKIARTTSRLLDLAKRTTRVQDPLKSGKGTCFDDLLIAGKYDEEELDMYFSHNEHPDLHLRVYFAAIQEDENEDIFDRGRSAFNLWGVTIPTIHQRSYSFQGMTANEDGMSSPSETDNGRTNYSFQFETRRSNGSIERPQIRVVMDFINYHEGKRIGTDFSQGEAKALWEAIIKTLRPRPGAVR